MYPQREELRNQLLTEAHITPYSIHPGATKMYKDLKEGFWWSGMKKDVANYVAKCLVCQKIKAKHQRPASSIANRDSIVEMGANFHGFCGWFAQNH